MKKNKRKKIILILAIILAIILIFILNRETLLKILYPKIYSEIITTYAQEYAVDENLVYALIKAESNFDNQAISNKSAIGLIQIVEETAIDVARKNNIDIDSENVVEELMDIDNNIRNFAYLLWNGRSTY